MKGREVILFLFIYTGVERRLLKENTMKFGKLDKGVAGLNLFLSLIVMLFVIGLVVMIFALMGGELNDATDDTTAKQVIGNTSDALKSSVDWFDIFIVIGAMVVLILLTVIIIAAIRGSGLIAAGGTA